MSASIAARTSPRGRPVPGAMRPSASRLSYPPGCATGEIFATGRPRSVTTKVSPALTLASHRLAYRRSSRIPTVFMCDMVAHLHPRVVSGSSPKSQRCGLGRSSAQRSRSPPQFVKWVVVPHDRSTVSPYVAAKSIGCEQRRTDMANITAHNGIDVDQLVQTIDSPAPSM